MKKVYSLIGANLLATALYFVALYGYWSYSNHQPQIIKLYGHVMSFLGYTPKPAHLGMGAINASDVISEDKILLWLFMLVMALSLFSMTMGLSIRRSTTIHSYAPANVSWALVILLMSGYFLSRTSLW